MPAPLQTNKSVPIREYLFAVVALFAPEHLGENLPQETHDDFVPPIGPSFQPKVLNDLEEIENHIGQVVTLRGVIRSSSRQPTLLGVELTRGVMMTAGTAMPLAFFQNGNTHLFQVVQLTQRSRKAQTTRGMLERTRKRSYDTRLMKAYLALVLGQNLLTVKLPKEQEPKQTRSPPSTRLTQKSVFNWDSHRSFQGRACGVLQA